MVSRIFVIVLAFGVAAYQFSRGALYEAVGLLGLGTGLVFLKVGETRPELRRYAYLCFLITAVVIVIVLFRGRH